MNIEIKVASLTTVEKAIALLPTGITQNSIFIVSEGEWVLMKWVLFYFG